MVLLRIRSIGCKRTRPRGEKEKGGGVWPFSANLKDLDSKLDWRSSRPPTATFAGVFSVTVVTHGGGDLRSSASGEGGHMISSSKNTLLMDFWQTPPAAQAGPRGGGALFMAYRKVITAAAVST